MGPKQVVGTPEVFLQRDKRRILKWLLNAVLTGFVLLAALFLAVWLSSRSRLSGILNSLATVQNANGSIGHPTQGGVNGVIARLPFVAGFFSICAITVSVFKGRLNEFLLAIPGEWPEIREFLREQFPANTQVWLEVATVSSLTAFGIFLRLRYIGRPIHYDEAVTYLNYASKPLYRGLSSYSYPNNHLLNTLLARLSILLFGDSTFSLRLPALVAGCIVIPLAWFTGRILYNRVAGILTAGCVVALPTFVDYSVNSRGYSLQWVFILLMICCSAVLLMKPAWKTLWLVFMLSGVLGIYSIPSMVIPILGCVIWLLLSGLFAGGLESAKGLLAKLIPVGLAMGLLAVLLYIPPLLSNGPAAVLSNRFVAPRAGPFLVGLGPLAHSMWIRWTDGVPIAIVFLLLGGTALGLLCHFRVAAQPLPLTLVLWIWTFCFAWARNIVGYPRVWNYLLLATVMTAAAGLSFFIEKLSAPSWRIAVASIISICLTLGIGVSVIRQRLLFRSNETAALPNIIQVIEFLRSNLRAGDALAIGNPGDPIVQYELFRHDPKLYVSLAPLDSARRVIVVLPKPDVDSEAYTTDQLWARLSVEGEVDPTAASSEIDLSQYLAPQLLANFLGVTIYSFERR